MLRPNRSPSPPPSPTCHRCIYDSVTNSCSGTYNFNAPPHAVAGEVPSLPCTAHTPLNSSQNQSLHIKRIKKMRAIRQWLDQFLLEEDEEKYSDVSGEITSQMLKEMKDRVRAMKQWWNQFMLEEEEQYDVSGQSNTSNPSKDHLEAELKRQQKQKAEFHLNEIEEEDCGFGSGNFGRLALLRLNGHHSPTAAKAVVQGTIISSMSIVSPSSSSAGTSSRSPRTGEASLDYAEEGPNIKRPKRMEDWMKEMVQWCDQVTFEGEKDNYTSNTLKDLQRLNKMKDRMRAIRQWCDQFLHEEEEDHADISGDDNTKNTSKETYQIFVKDLCGKSIGVKVEGGETIERLKKRMEAKLGGIPVNCLLYEGRLLNDSKSLMDYEIHNNCSLHLSSQLQGGMKKFLGCFGKSSGAASTSGAASGASEPPPPVTLAELVQVTFNFQNHFAEGETAFVYRARLRGQDVAIKRMKVDGTPAEVEARNRQFKNEHRVLQLCDHQFILGIDHFLEDEERRCYTVSRYMPYGTVVRYILPELHWDRTWRLSWIHTLNVIYGVALALEYLHERKDGPIYHGDLNTSNILLDAYLRPRLADFGKSKCEGDEDVYENTAPFGTSPYLPPRPEPLGPYTDIYAFGAVVYELLTGSHAFIVEAGSIINPFAQWEQECHVFEDKRKALDQRLALWRPYIRRASIPGLIRLVRRCTEWDPGRRPDIKRVVTVVRSARDIQRGLV